MYTTIDQAKIKHNKVKCRGCKQVVESAGTKDIAECTCKSIAIYGGKESLGRLWRGPAMYDELSEHIKT